MKDYKLGDLVLITTIDQLNGLKKAVYIFNRISKSKMFNDGYYLTEYYQSISNPFEEISSRDNYLTIDYLA